MLLIWWIGKLIVWKGSFKPFGKFLYERKLGIHSGKVGGKNFPEHIETSVASTSQFYGYMI